MKTPCKCEAYKFPHRENSGKCHGDSENTPATSYSDGEEAHNAIRHDNAVYAARGEI